MTTLAGGAKLVRNVGFGFFSVAVHLCMVVVAVVVASPVVHSYADQRELIDVDIQPALGQPHGKDEGKGLGSHVEIPKAPELKDDRPPPAPPPDPDAIPTTIASASAAPATSAASSDADAGAAEEGGTAESSGTADLTTPVGSENVGPGFGSPDGVEGGQGTAPPKAKMTPQYAGILAGWFGARFNLRGVDLPDDGARLAVSVSVSMSPSRQITAWSLNGSSGNAEFDDAVKRTMTSVQGSATLPAPPDGGEAPPMFTTRFVQPRARQQ